MPPLDAEIAKLQAQAAWQEFCRRKPWALVGCNIVVCEVCGSQDMIYRNRLAPGSIYRCRKHGGITKQNSTVD